MQEAERDCGAASGAPDGELEQLREELAKWRARVPRLASALRQRTEELEALRRQAASSDRPGALHPADAGSSEGLHAGDAGIRQRDALIAELETKVQTLDRSLRNAQGEKHACGLELDGLRDEVGSWKQKWQDATQSLDDHGRLLAQARQERDRLEERNAQLLETTELANRQIETLWGTVEELRQQVQRGAEREAEASRRLEQAVAETVQLDARFEALSHDADDLGGFAQTLCASAIASAQDVHAANQRLEALRRDKDAELQALRQRAEQAEETLHRAERAAEENAQHVAQLDARFEALSHDADDLGGFAQTLCASAIASAQDVHAANQRLEALRRDKDAELQALRQRAEQAEETLHRAERAAEENAQHVAQLDDRLERQKELLAELEKELAEARTVRVGTEQQRQALAAGNTEIAALKEKVRALEGMVREQTAELGREIWQRDFAEARPAEGADSRMLLVLNQQLESARAENASLTERLHELEDELTHLGMQRDGDDLTLIHGVGPKLARQLNAMGIFRLEQIAELDPDGLADETHLLYAHKARILRDGWIEQAARLISH